MHRILLLADLHIGNIKDVTHVYNAITEIFDKELMNHKTDVIVILGDYFDKLMKVNEDSTSLAINIMSYLINMCRTSKTKIRLIYGTESHEMSQYRLFNYHLTDTTVDFKIIDTVFEEELLPGISVLYIPEEYMESKEKHYKEYLYSKKKYTYIFGHGVIIEGMPMMKFNEGVRSNEKKVPYFKSAELSRVSDYYAFGHYHNHIELDGGCYIGSTLRNSFGEEDPKGYGVLENGKFTFIENNRARKFKTYTFEEDSDVYTDTDHLVKEIKRIKKENENIFNGDDHGRIRFLFNTPSDIDLTFRENLRSILFDEKHISTLVKSSVIDVENKEAIKEEYAWILDNSLPPEDKIHRFIEDRYDSPMTLSELTKYINEPLTT